jgi:VanZ family protein
MKIKYLYPFIWLGIIAFASLTPSDKLPHIQLFKHADKLIHWAMYFGLVIFLIPSFVKGNNYKTSYALTFLFSLFIGIMMEYLQIHITHGRSAEMGDIIADGIGTITGILFYNFLVKNKKTEKLIFRI